MNLQETVSKMQDKKVSVIDARFFAEGQFGALASYIRGTNPAVTKLIETYSTQLATQKENRSKDGERETNTDIENFFIDKEISRTAEFIRILKSLNNDEK